VLNLEDIKLSVKRYQNNPNETDSNYLYQTLENVLIACKYVMERNTHYNTELNSYICVCLDILSKMDINNFDSISTIKAYIYKAVYWRIFGDFKNEIDTRKFELSVLDMEKNVSDEELYENNDYGIVFSDSVKNHKYFNYYKKIATLIHEGYSEKEIVKRLRITKKEYRKLIKELKRL